MGLHILFRIQRKLPYAFLYFPSLVSTPYTLYARIASCTTDLTDGHVAYKTYYYRFCEVFVWFGVLVKNRLVDY